MTFMRRLQRLLTVLTARSLFRSSQFIGSSCATLQQPFFSICNKSFTLSYAMSGQGRGAAAGAAGAAGEEAISVCERATKVNETGYEGFKGTDEDNEYDEDDVEYLEALVTFSVDHPISLIGVKFASEIYPNPKDAGSDTEESDTYEEEAFIYLLEGNVKLAETHIDDEVPYRSIMEARFENPMKIEKKQIYKIRVLCNVDGAYPLAECSKEEEKDGVKFQFKVGKPEDCKRDGMIRALIFKKL